MFYALEGTVIVMLVVLAVEKVEEVDMSQV